MAIVFNEDGQAGKVCNKCHSWKLVAEYSKTSIPRADGYYYTCKVCHNALRRAQRKADAERFRAKGRDYYRRNRQRVIKTVQLYREAHPDRVKASNRAYYERNHEERKQAQRLRNKARRALFGKQINAYQRAYYRVQKQNNPIKRRQQEREQERRRRNRRMHADGSHTEAEWERLKLHYIFTCLCCGRQEPDITLVRDHIVPISQGGSDWITNLQPLCPSCNSSKGIKTIDYRELWRNTHHATSETPVDH